MACGEAGKVNRSEREKFLVFAVDWKGRGECTGEENINRSFLKREKKEKVKKRIKSGNKSKKKKKR